MKIGIFYGSTTGNTKRVADLIATELGGATVKNIATTSADELLGFDVLLLGTSTWGLGDLQDDWEGFLSNFNSLNLEGKKVGFFGLGDQFTYADNYVDGMGSLAEAVKATGAIFIGEWDADGYECSDSRAKVNDFTFVGLAIDENNQSDQTATRVSEWVSQIKSEIA